MQKCLIYDPTAVSRIEDVLSEQERLFQNEDKSSKVQEQKVIRYAVIVGISALAILLLKIVVKKKK